MKEPVSKSASIGPAYETTGSTASRKACRHNSAVSLNHLARAVTMNPSFKVVSIPSRIRRAILPAK